MNQEYRGKVKRWLESGGDPKYVNVKKKAEKRMQDEVYKENLKGDFSRHPVTGNKISKTKAQVKAIKAKMAGKMGEKKEHNRFKKAMERHEGEMKTHVSKAWDEISKKKGYENA